MTKFKFFAYSLLVLPIVIFAQEEATDSSNSEVEEVVVVGSQIKGASITDALPVFALSIHENSTQDTRPTENVDRRQYRRRPDECGKMANGEPRFWFAIREQKSIGF